MRCFGIGLIFMIFVFCESLSCAGCQTQTTALAKTEEQPDKQPEITTGEKGPLSFEIVPGQSKLLSGHPSKLNILFRLSGKEVKISQRPPLNLGIIVDRSGSMTGEKIASVKVAALELIKKLNKNDTVTLVSYSSDVRIHQQAVPIDSEWSPVVKSQILGIRAGGMTALGPALVDTLGLMEKNNLQQNEITHVLLLSDGLANVGVTSADVLGQKTSGAFTKGISVSTLGVGLDYNEDLMTYVADQGGGQYHFVKDTQSITTVLSDELRGLESTVARNIEIAIAHKDGVKALKSYGYPTRIEANRTVVKIGSMRSGQNRDIMLQLDIDPMAASRLKVGDFEMSFKDATNDNAQLLATASLDIGITSEPKEVDGTENTEVTVLVAELKSAEKLEVAARAVESGDFNSAQEILNGSINSLKIQAQKTPDTKIDKQIKSMQTAIIDLDDAKKNFKSRKTYIKKKKAESYIQRKKAYKKKKIKPKEKRNFNKHSKK